MYGFEIQEVLDIKIIIDKFINQSKIHKLCRRLHYKIDIITYTEILNRLKTNYQDTYSEFENLPGFTLYLEIRINSINKNEENYILDYGKSENKNRFSIYLDKMGQLCSRVIDNDGKIHTVIVASDEIIHNNNWFYLNSEFGKTKNGFYHSISINGIEKESRVHNSKIEDFIEFNLATIGCSISMKQFSSFDDKMIMLFDKTLDYRAKIGIKELLETNLNNNENRNNYIRYDGTQYMSRNKQGDFEQTNQLFKPKFMEE